MTLLQIQGYLQSQNLQGKGKVGHGQTWRHQREKHLEFYFLVQFRKTEMLALHITNTGPHHFQWWLCKNLHISILPSSTSCHPFYPLRHQSPHQRLGSSHERKSFWSPEILQRWLGTRSLPGNLQSSQVGMVSTPPYPVIPLLSWLWPRALPCPIQNLHHCNGKQTQQRKLH